MTVKASIGAKQWGPTSGLTDTLFSRLYNNKGTHIMAIVELKSEYAGENVDGDRDVKLSIEKIEAVVAQNGDVEATIDEHVRTLQNALSYERALATNTTDELPFDEKDGPSPKVTDVLQQGKGLTTQTEDGDTAIYDPQREPSPA